MKPSWKDAPEWAQYLAMDENGEWWWYSEIPAVMSDNSTWTIGLCQTGARVRNPGWRDTLEKRPVPKTGG